MCCDHCSSSSSSSSSSSYCCVYYSLRPGPVITTALPCAWQQQRDNKNIEKRIYPTLPWEQVRKNKNITQEWKVIQVTFNTNTFCFTFTSMLLLLLHVLQVNFMKATTTTKVDCTHSKSVVGWLLARLRHVIFKQPFYFCSKNAWAVRMKKKMIQRGSSRGLS